MSFISLLYIFQPPTLYLSKCYHSIALELFLALILLRMYVHCTLQLHNFLQLCMHACIHTCMYISVLGTCIHVCMYVYMQLRMYVSMHAFMYIYQWQIHKFKKRIFIGSRTQKRCGGMQPPATEDVLTFKIHMYRVYVAMYNLMKFYLTSILQTWKDSLG